MTVSIDVVHTSGITAVQLEFDGVNHTMSNEGDMYYYTWAPISVTTIPYTLYMESQSGTWNTLSDSVLVVDTTDPTWVTAPTDRVLVFGESFSMQLVASDLSGIADWAVDDDVNFEITDGLLTNKTVLAPGGYSLEVTVTDNEGNSLSTTFRVAVVESLTIPTTTPGQPTTPDSSILVIVALVGIIAILTILLLLQRKKYIKTS